MTLRIQNKNRIRGNLSRWKLLFTKEIIDAYIKFANKHLEECSIST